MKLLAFITVSLVSLASPAGHGATAKNLHPVSLMSTKGTLQVSKTSLWVYSHETEESVQQARQEALVAKRTSLISQLETILRKEAKSEERIELNLRLGKLYLEDYHYYLEQAVTRYTTEMEAHRKSGSKERTPKLNTLRPSVALNRARSVYRFLAKTYLKHPRRDEMLFFFGLTSFDKNLPKDAVAAFGELVEKYPRSVLWADAMAQIADYNFENNHYDKALALYDQILRDKQGKLKSYATYKKSWCQFNLGKTTDALAGFISVIENTDLDSLSSGIKREALKDVQLVFVALGKVQNSIAFFSKQEASVFGSALQNMAFMYFEKGEYDSSITLWDTSLKHAPLDAKAPQQETQVVEAFVRKNDFESASKRLLAKTAEYRSPSAWYEANKNNQKLIAQAELLFETHTLNHAVAWHGVAVKTKNNDLFALSKNIYLSFLDLFPKSKQTYLVQFNLGKVYFAEKEYLAAADRYFKAFQLASPKTDAATRYAALVQAVASLDLQLTKEYKEQGVHSIGRRVAQKLTDSGDTTDSEVAPYTDSENNFITVAKQFLKSFPKSEETPDVLHELGYMHYLHLNFSEATPLFNQLVFQHQAHPTASSAGLLMVDILNRKKDYPALIKLCAEILRSGPSGKRFRLSIEDSMRRGDLKRIEKIESEGKFSLAADAYLRYTTHFGPQDESLHQKALFNASVNLERSDRIAEAAESLETFLRTFKTSSLKPMVLLNLAKQYESMGNFRRSAQYYSDFTTQNPRHREAGSALRLSALFAWSSGDLEQAEKRLLSLQNSYPDRTGQVESDLFQVYLAKGKSGKALDVYEAYRNQKGISHYAFVNTTNEMSKLENLRGKTLKAKELKAQAFKTAVQYARSLKKTAKGADLLAELHLENLAVKEKEFYSLKLVSTSKKPKLLEKALQRKIELLKELEEDFVRVATIGSEAHGLTAIYKTAAAYQHFASEAAVAPVPSQLNARDMEHYNKEVKSTMIDPFNEKARQLANRCLEEGAALKLLSPWLVQCGRLSAVLDPEKSPVIRTPYLQPMQLAQVDGNVDDGAYPERYLSSSFYQPAVERSQASLSIQGQGLKDISDTRRIDTVQVDYRNSAPKRKQALETYVMRHAPGRGEKPTLAYLNALRIVNPDKALVEIRSALEKKASSAQLHNLLALTYLEKNQIQAAEIIWQAMLGRKQGVAAVLNNLAIISFKKEQWSDGLANFKKAVEEGSVEASINLGHYALGCRNGAEAKAYFKKAEELGATGPAVDGGMAVALIQLGEQEVAKQKMADATQRYPNDGFTALTTIFYFLDVERDAHAASNIVDGYLKKIPEDRENIHFIKLKEEAKQLDQLVSVEEPKME